MQNEGMEGQAASHLPSDEALYAQTRLEGTVDESYARRRLNKVFGIDFPRTSQLSTA